MARVEKLLEECTVLCLIKVRINCRRSRLLCLTSFLNSLTEFLERKCFLTLPCICLLNLRRANIGVARLHSELDTTCFLLELAKRHSGVWSALICCEGWPSSSSSSPSRGFCGNCCSVSWFSSGRGLRAGVLPYGDYVTFGVGCWLIGKDEQASWRLWKWGSPTMEQAKWSKANEQVRRVK